MVKIPHFIEELCDFIFGLPYAGPCIPLLICGALSVAAINQFTLGYVLFALGGIWALGHWWISDPVKERRRLIGWHQKLSQVVVGRGDILLGIYCWMFFVGPFNKDGIREKSGSREIEHQVRNAPWG
jgi:hypothetical protein